MQQPEEISSLVNKKSSYHHPATISLSLSPSLFEGFALEADAKGRVASKISDDLLRVVLFFVPIRVASEGYE